MTHRLAAFAIANRALPAAGALALLLAAAPASAEQARAVLSVTANVVPSPAGASVSRMTAVRADERPLDEAAAILGAPVRRGRSVAFTAPARVASAGTAGRDRARTRYLTLTY